MAVGIAAHSTLPTSLKYDLVPITPKLGFLLNSFNASMIVLLSNRMASSSKLKTTSLAALLNPKFLPPATPKFSDNENRRMFSLLETYASILIFVSPSLLLSITIIYDIRSLTISSESKH